MFRHCLISLLTLAASSFAAAASAGQPPSLSVDQWVLETTENAATTEFIVFLQEQADLSFAATIRAREQRGRAVHDALVTTAAGTQGPILALLEAAGVAHRAYWVANMIWVRGDRDLVMQLAARNDVARISANPSVKLAAPIPAAQAPGETAAVEPSIQQIGVPDTFWANGITGDGIVIGGQDTGYDWDHPALRDHYRGWNGATADHNYHWHDAIHSGGGVCGADATEPCDDNNHGTHTMGTMVGDDGGSNQIGVAPGATWIGCRNMDRGNGTPATYSECFQWFIAPTDLSGQNPRPEMAPHVINNSWSCPPSEGCTDPKVMRTVVNNTRAAGIMVVVSAGNSGSGCGSISTPSAIYDASTTVGSVNSQSQISSFSSRGPVDVDGSGRLKPDLTAPGESIRSSVPGGGYSRLSGTSMAGPHVAGMAALVMASQDCLVRDVDAVEAFMKKASQPWLTSQTCGGISGNEVPNNTYGYGEIRSALPGPADCVAPVGVGAGGLRDGAFGLCLNQATGARVVTPLDNALALDCEAAGLSANSGDRVVVLLRGAARGSELQGTLTGLRGLFASCRNQVTGQAVSTPLGGADAWDCSAAGLNADPGQTVQQVLVGTVE
jgi:serine protease AprX